MVCCKKQTIQRQFFLQLFRSRGPSDIIDKYWHFIPLSGICKKLAVFLSLCVDEFWVILLVCSQAVSSRLLEDSYSCSVADYKNPRSSTPASCIPPAATVLLEWKRLGRPLLNLLGSVVNVLLSAARGAAPGGEHHPCAFRTHIWWLRSSAVVRGRRVCFDHLWPLAQFTQQLWTVTDSLGKWWRERGQRKSQC